MNDRSNVWRLLPLLAALVLMMGSAYVSCSYNAPVVQPRPVLSFATELQLEDESGRPSRAFSVGERIHMILTVRNRLSQTAQVDFASSTTYDFIVVKADTDTILWQWSATQPQPRSATTITFGPDETKTFEATWNQFDNSGQPVPPDNYEARGLLVFDGFEANPMQSNQFASAPVKFVIE